LPPQLPDLLAERADVRAQLCLHRGEIVDGKLLLVVHECLSVSIRDQRGAQRTETDGGNGDHVRLGDL
jgi:hypothetical protein